MAKKKAKKGGKKKKKKKKSSSKKKSSKKKASRRVAGKKKKAAKKKAKPARPKASTAMTAPAPMPSAAANQGARTALNPAAAWPFPTGSRP